MEQQDDNQILCLRCQQEMTIIGTKQFSEGTDWSSWLGQWGKLLNRKEKLDMMGCLNCGKVEFFFKDVLTKTDLKNEKSE